MRRLSARGARSRAWLGAARPVRPLAARVARPLPARRRRRWLAFATPHNGWVWYSGGDATEYWTAQWSLAHGLIPQALDRLRLAVFYAGVPLVSRADARSHGLPVIVLLQRARARAARARARLGGRRPALRPRCTRRAARRSGSLGPLARDLAVRRPATARRYEQYFARAALGRPHDMADFPSLVAVLATRVRRRSARSTGRVDRRRARRGVLARARDRAQAGERVLPAGARRARRAGAAAARRSAARSALAPALADARDLEGPRPRHAAAARRLRRRRVEASAGPLAARRSRLRPLDWHHLSVRARRAPRGLLELRLLEFLPSPASSARCAARPASGLLRRPLVRSPSARQGKLEPASIDDASYFRLDDAGARRRSLC